jgi:hypothetical protein
MLFAYMEQVERFIHDTRQELVDPADIISYVNRARREVAMRTQCIRRLPPITGAIIGASIVSGGHGYTNPSVSISAPDFPSGQPPTPNGAQATAIATEMGGSIVAVNMSYGGDGYFQPQITITDPTGTGASITAVMSYINQTNGGQEVYPFSAVNLNMFPGVDSIYTIRSVSVLYSNYRYSLRVPSFSSYQAFWRQYPSFQYQWAPVVCAQFGQGTDGSFYLFPTPSQAFQMEFDCFCLPSDLATDQDFEAIPKPWQDAVPYFAASLAYLDMQNFNYARGYEDMFDRRVTRFSQYARPGHWVNPYGRA